jgi:hypothetical protein
MEKLLAFGPILLVIAIWLAGLRYFHATRKIGLIPALTVHADRSPALFRILMITLWMGFALTAAFGGLLLVVLFSGK